MSQTTVHDSELDISRLYRRYEPQVSAYARRRASEADAADIVAETFLVAWRRREDIPAEPNTLPWLYGVARRALANNRRGAARRTRLNDRLLDTFVSEEISICRLESSERFAKVAEALDELSDDDAELLRLTAWEGFGTNEIAESMCIEPTAARQRLHRARKRLQARVGQSSTPQPKWAAILVALATTIGALLAVLGNEDQIVETDFIEQPAPDIEQVEPDTDNATARAAVDVDEIESDAAEEPEPNDGSSSTSAASTTSDISTLPVREDTAPTTIGVTTTVSTREVAPTTSTEAAPTTSNAAAPETTATSTTVPATTATSTTATVTTATNGPFVVGRDLLAAHFDFAHLDDGHATVATAEVAHDFNLVPLVVAGTQSTESSSFVHPFDRVMNATWGTDWLDARANRQNAITQASSAWIATLDRGGHVWVAEGGVSDFTAEILRSVLEQRPEIDTSVFVHVVQHAGRNENETAEGELAFVQAHSDYIGIDDGNQINQTAGLNGSAVGFVNAASTSVFATGWSEAFAAMSANNLDFSDTVTVLHPLGIGIGEVADTAGFAARFMS